jgi:hypothetical protein
LCQNLSISSADRKDNKYIYRAFFYYIPNITNACSFIYELRRLWQIMLHSQKLLQKLYLKKWKKNRKLKCISVVIQSILPSRRMRLHGTGHPKVLGRTKTRTVCKDFEDRTYPESSILSQCRTWNHKLVTSTLFILKTTV